MCALSAMEGRKSTTKQDDDADDEQKGKYVQGSQLKDLLAHIRSTLGFEEKVQLEDSFYS